MQSISIIIPVYNEIGKLPKLIKRLNPYKYDNQIILINDGSQDGTREFLNAQSDLLIIHHDKNLGKGSAIRTALEKVNQETVMLIDGDLEINIKNLNSFFKVVDKNQIMVGYRVSNNINPYSLIEFGNTALNFIFNLLFSSNYKDVLCCFKIIPTKTLKDFNLSAVGFELETEIMAKICMSNLQVIEKGVQYKRRTNKDGKKLRIIDSYVILKKMVGLKLKLYFS
jgi:glycosyltransferase involved in cell wall biosynthesis